MFVIEAQLILTSLFKFFILLQLRFMTSTTPNSSHIITMLIFTRATSPVFHLLFSFLATNSAPNAISNNLISLKKKQRI